MLDTTPLLRLFARYRLAKLGRLRPVEAQARQLRRLLARGERTKFGRDHGFSRIRSVADYQAAVPLRHYDDFWADYWQSAFPLLDDLTWPGRIPYFARSSGTTTGATKFIPVTREMCRSNRRAVIDLLVHHITDRPKSRI